MCALSTDHSVIYGGHLLPLQESGMLAVMAGGAGRMPIGMAHSEALSLRVSVGLSWTEALDVRYCPVLEAGASALGPYRKPVPPFLQITYLLLIVPCICAL